MRGSIGRRFVLAGSATLLAGVYARKCAAQGQAQDVDLKSPETIVRQAPAAAPDVGFTRLDGSAVKLAAFRGKPVVLNFWATWCGPCVAELPELDRLAADKAVTVLAVSADRGGAARVAGFLAKHPMAHATVLLDPDSAAVHAFGVFGFPTTVIVDAQGRVRGRLEGPATWSTAAGVVGEMTK